MTVISQETFDARTEKSTTQTNLTSIPNPIETVMATGQGKPVKLNATSTAAKNGSSSKKRKTSSNGQSSSSATTTTPGATSAAAAPVSSAALPTPETTPLPTAPEPPKVATSVPTAVDSDVSVKSEQSAPTSDEENRPEDTTVALERFHKEVVAVAASMRQIVAKLKEIQKIHNKEKKLKSKKRKSVDGEGENAKPEETFYVKEPLHSFLKLEDGQKIGKRAARKEVQVYIKQENLLEPKDRRIINPNAELLNILGEPRFVTTGTNKGYSNLNCGRYLQDYFIPNDPPAAPASTSNAPPAPVNTTSLPEVPTPVTDV